MIIYVDIDNTIFKTEGTDYTKCEPMLDRIEAINNLYDQGHEIVYWTARGTNSKTDWEVVTKSQFRRYKVKYNSLKFGKPVYDLFIDDKNINSEEFFK